MKSVESFKERHTTWLENFYDLVVAIIVYQLSRDLYQDVSVNGFLIFVALFIPVIWSWIGVTFYSTRFETPTPNATTGCSCCLYGGKCTGWFR